MKLLISSVVANTTEALSPCIPAPTDRLAPLRSQADTACHSAHVRERFGACRTKPLTRFGRVRTRPAADVWFGIGSVANGGSYVRKTAVAFLRLTSTGSAGALDS